MAASSFAAPAVAVVTGPVLARALGTVGRGDYTAIIAPFNLGLAMFLVGVPTAVSYFAARRELSFRRARNLGWFCGLATGLVSSGVIWLLAPSILRSAPQYVTLMRVSGFLLVPAAMAAIVRGLHLGIGNFRVLSYERWLGTLARLVLIVALAATGALTVRDASWITLATAVAASLVLYAGIWREPKQEEKIRSEATLRAIFRFSGLAAIGEVSGSVIVRLDQAIMPVLSSARELAFYAVAVSIAEVPVLMSLAVRDVVFTTATERASPKLVADASRVVLIIQLLAALFAAPVMWILLPIVYGSAFKPAVGPTEILLLAGALGAPGSVLNSGLLGQNAPGPRSVAQVGAAVVTVVTLVLLVPPLGADGAALASMAAYVFSSISNAVLLARLTPVTIAECLLPRPRDAVEIIARTKAALPDGFGRPPKRFGKDSTDNAAL